MQEEAKGAEIRLGRVRISARAIEEVVDRTALVSVPRADVRRVVLRRGVMAERPLFLTALGAAFSALGAYGLFGMAQAVSRGAPIWGRTGAALLIAAVGGPLLIAAALRRGFVLEVSTERETRKLGIARRVEPAELDQFAAAAARAGVIVERP